MGLFLSSLFCSIDVCLFLTQYHTLLVPVALKYILKSGSVMPPTLFFLFKIALTSHGLLWFHMHFVIVFFSLFRKKKGIEILIWIILSPQIALGSMDIFNNM